MKKTFRYAAALFALAASLSAEPQKVADITV